MGAEHGSQVTKKIDLVSWSWRACGVGRFWIMAAAAYGSGVRGGVTRYVGTVLNEYKIDTLYLIGQVRT